MFRRIYAFMFLMPFMANFYGSSKKNSFRSGKTDLKYKRWKDRTREGCRQAREQTGN